MKFGERLHRTASPALAKVEGRWVELNAEISPVSDAAYACNHDLIGSRSRCLGCGRTRNEIELDGG